MSLTPLQRKKAAELVQKEAEKVVVRYEGENGFSYYLRCLMWSVTSEEGRKAMMAAFDQVSSG